MLAYGCKDGDKKEIIKLIKKHFNIRYRYAIASLKVAKTQAQLKLKEADKNIEKTIHIE